MSIELAPLAVRQTYEYERSATKNTFMLFRENNVIVQLWLSKDQFNEVITYANTIEKRMGDYVQIKEGTSKSN